jgi:ParB family chromosome partitioning protein
VPRKGFFERAPRSEADDAARMADVAALLPARRTSVQDLPIARIRPNPFQARQSFADLDDLAQSIRVQGFTSRLRVRPDPTESGYFQLVYGERRLRAAGLAGLTVVPCEIAEHTDAELLEIGLAENIQRRDLDPLEEAQAFGRFIDQLGYSTRSLAERIGKNKSYVEDRLALLRAPSDVQALVAARADTVQVARQIARLPDPVERAPLIAGVLEGSLTKEAVRQAVQTRKDPAPAHPPAPPAPIPAQLALVEQVLATWGALAEQDPRARAEVRQALDTLEAALTALRHELAGS